MKRSGREKQMVKPTCKDKSELLFIILSALMLAEGFELLPNLPVN